MNNHKQGQLRERVLIPVNTLLRSSFRLGHTNFSLDQDLLLQSANGIAQEDRLEDGPVLDHRLVAASNATSVLSYGRLCESLPDMDLWSIQEFSHSRLPGADVNTAVLIGCVLDSVDLPHVTLRNKPARSKFHELQSELCVNSSLVSSTHSEQQKPRELAF